MDFQEYGEDGIRVVFGEGVDQEVNEKVRRFYYSVKRIRPANVLDVIPSFRSCLIHFESGSTSFQDLTALLNDRKDELDSMPAPALHEIPVRYGGEDGPDMDFICRFANLSEEEVIEIHSGPVYTVFAVGFTPGFPYLGPLDGRIHVPRLESPRLKVPKGSVGVAQSQTGIYSFESPAGWQILGRTAVNLFDCKNEPYSLLAPGDRVRFVRI